MIFTLKKKSLFWHAACHTLLLLCGRDTDWDGKCGENTVFLLNNESGSSWKGPGDTHKEGETAWVTQINLFIHRANSVTLTVGQSLRQESYSFL